MRLTPFQIYSLCIFLNNFHFNQSMKWGSLEILRKNFFIFWSKTTSNGQRWRYKNHQKYCSSVQNYMGKFDLILSVLSFSCFYYCNQEKVSVVSCGDWEINQISLYVFAPRFETVSQMLERYTCLYCNKVTCAWEVGTNVLFKISGDIRVAISRIYYSMSPSSNVGCYKNLNTRLSTLVCTYLI